MLLDVARGGLAVEDEAVEDGGVDEEEAVVMDDEAVDDEELNRFWNSRYRLLSRSCGLAHRAMPLEYMTSASCGLAKSWLRMYVRPW